ncbi:hypothetical protein [Microbacterium cremeum]|uniref:hypothetical protein n=1 Tax=Microbacterium cremeum TaxID=2782169 RepID=UPI001888B008|nr:hypothetical protein [Microbacterium cremeum]
MPRVRRQIDDGPVYDPVREELDEMRRRMPPKTPEQVAESERHREKFLRRLAKAEAAWRVMPVLERKAWADAYLAEERRGYNPNAQMPKQSELPGLYAVVTVCEKDNAKRAKTWKRESAKRAEAEAQRAAGAAAERATRRATAPVPAPEAPAAPDEPPRRRKRRSGPRYGVVAVRMPDGTMRAPIYDDDER